MHSTNPNDPDKLQESESLIEEQNEKNRKIIK